MHDLANRPLKTIHIDKGASTVVMKGPGLPVEMRDAKGAAAGLSDFLLGNPVTPAPDDLFMVADAAGRPSHATSTQRGFNDLWRRALDLRELIDRPCRPVLVPAEAFMRVPAHFQH